MRAHRRPSIPPDRPLALFSTTLPTTPSWECLPARPRQIVAALLAHTLPSLPTSLRHWLPLELVEGGGGE